LEKFATGDVPENAPSIAASDEDRAYERGMSRNVTAVPQEGIDPLDELAVT
jgi:hypothetical protein